MAKRVSLPLKIVLYVLGTLLGLVILALVAFQVILHTSALEKIACKVAASYVDGDVSIGDLDLSLVKNYPDVTVSLEDLLVTYPHDRFDGVAGPEDEGRGEAADTLASIGRLLLTVDARSFLDRHEIDVKEAALVEPRAFLHKYDSLLANWQVIRLPEKDSTKVEKESAISGYSVEKLQIDRPRVVFVDAVSPLAATLAFSDLELKGECRPGSDSIYVDAGLGLTELSAGELIPTLGATFVPTLSALQTDALVSLDVEVDGWIHLDSMSDLPPVRLSLDIPESLFTLAGYVRGARLSLSADAENTDANVKNVDVNDLKVNMDGLDLAASGAADDLLGKDPLLQLEACAKADLGRILKYLPKSLQELFVASGNVDLDVAGSIKKSQLGLYSCSDADISAKLTGDVLLVKDEKDGIECYLEHPDIKLSTMRSAVDSSDSALGLRALVDSVDFDLGESLCAKGRNLMIFAQNASKSINDSSMWHPFAGKVTADQLSLKSGDSLRVWVRNSENRFTVTPYLENGRNFPNLRLDSDNAGILFKNSSAFAAASDASFSAAARMMPKRQRPVRDSLQRRQFVRRELSDSLVVPEFLRERDFRASDIRIDVGQSVKDLLRTWNPAGDIAVGKGFFASPAFPLRTRFSDVAGSFQEDELKIKNIKVTSGTSDVSASADVKGLKRMLTRGFGYVDVDLRLKSERLNVNEILAAFVGGKKDSADLGAIDVEDGADALAAENLIVVDSLDSAGLPESYSLFVLPANVNADVHVDAASVNYADIDVRSFHSDISMRERCLQMLDTRATTDMGSFGLDAFYSTKTKQDITVGFNLKLNDVTADRIIEMIPAVDEYIPMLKSFKGNLNCEMAAASQLDTNMNFLAPTINGMFKIGGTGLVLEDIGSLEKITKVLMFKDKTTGRIDDMTISGVIADSMLEVFPFILSVDRYTLALQGIQNFNKSFDYHASIIKSPLPLKVGVKIYGSDFDNWKYRIGRAKYRTTKVPVFNDAVDNMQGNLVSSIKNIFSKGVERALAEARESKSEIERRKKDLDYNADDEVLDYDEQMQLEQVLIEREIEDESAALAEEIDRMIAQMM